ncbi:hypothetical protein [Actinacidiphila sp. ITFR-21]|uniref:hypothetical protein n=1 Tax=Actinacidiphila sp. ITFR-21 TaxID=3075199 RepID=UPI00288A61DD|nr:hypothetical protein [Streptomyces sp. ITFR-21]WNI15222.1 hypothetical protein RLT57_06515 [Streptomyces sp. ITFR-21]
MTLELVPGGQVSISGQPLDTPLSKSGQLLADINQVFARWLGTDYDLEALAAVLAVAAGERLTGDPCWLLVVSGSGAAKTETVMPLQGAGAVIVSTITGEAALISGTAEKEKAKDAHGGLLRKIGDRGILVIKDFTSILSMNRDARAAVLAALREIYDGRWDREIGQDGGKTLTWKGRLVVVGAVTTAWDSAHAVVSTMGDRFVLVRIDSKTKQGRRAAGLQALKNVSHEVGMREDLSNAVAALIKSVDTDQTIDLTDDDMMQLLGLADIVTLSRTAVERDYQGNVTQAHAPEMPTRFTKQLAQIMRGGIAIGMDRLAALNVAIRCAHDSMPPLRMALLADVVDSPWSRTADVVKRTQLPRKTVDRALQELHLLGLLKVDEQPYGEGTRWIYAVADDIDIDDLRKLARNGDRGHKGAAPSLARNGDPTPQSPMEAS